jgi:hypothetical protein
MVSARPLLAAFSLLPILTTEFQSSINAAAPALSRHHLSAQRTSTEDEPSQPLSSRRQFHQSISNSLLSTFICTQLPFAANAATKLETFTDADYGFRLSTPIEWKKTIQTLSGRRKALFFTPDNNDGIIDTLLIIAYTPVRDDFTSLSSFGSVDAVAQATILPKGELGGTADNSRMISAGETYLV